MPYRESRGHALVSVSQPGAGAAFDVSPDGTFATTIQSLDFTVMMQWCGGIDIAEGSTISSGDEDGGAPLDRKGDKLANAGEYNRRHNRVLRANYDMVSAVAIGPVVKGDKAAPEKTASINETHVLDLAEIGGDETTGGDVCIGSQVPVVPHPEAVARQRQCKERRLNGGQPAKVGHRFKRTIIYAFGNTEEWYRRSILGCKRQGRRADGPLNHGTGRGFVHAARRRSIRGCSSKGEPSRDHDRRNPRGRDTARALVRRLPQRACTQCTRAGLDSVRSLTDEPPFSFYTHHLQRISLAAQLGNAKAIRLSLRARKLKAFAARGGARA